MQARFCNFENSIYIPQTEGIYSTTMSGKVFDHLLGKQVKVFLKQNEPCIHFSVGESSFEIKIAVLLACVSKKILIPIQLWHLLDVMYVDGNVSNFHPSNTVWKYPDGGLRVNEKSDFCFIPGFSRYSVNKAGVIYSHVSNKRLSPYQDELGYWMYGLTPDIGKRTILGMHRAMALAHLTYPANVDKLDVNHKDGIKSQNPLDNLEWSTRKENCDHAYSTGLRKDNIQVDVRNAFTDEIQTFYSLEECARKLGIDGETVRLRTQSRGQKTYSPGYQFKSHIDETPWNKVNDPLEHMRRLGMSIPLKAISLDTDEIHIFNNTSDLAKFLGISPSGVTWHLRKIKNEHRIKRFRIEYQTLQNN